MTAPVDGRRDRALLEGPGRIADGGLRTAQPALGGRHHLLAGGQTLDRKLGFQLRDVARRRVARGDRAVEVGLAYDASGGEADLPVRLSLCLAQPGLCRRERGLRHGDLFGPAPLAQVCQIGSGLVTLGLGLGERDFSVGAVLPGDDVPRADPVTLTHRHLDQLGRRDRSKLDVLSLDITDAKKAGDGAGE